MESGDPAMDNAASGPSAAKRETESMMLALRAQLQECEERAAMFEHAAAERLRVIEHGDRLLREQGEAIAGFQQSAEDLRRISDTQAKEMQAAIASHGRERQRLEDARREAERGREELAARERALTRENLELRNERLLHSIIRRIRSIFQ